MSVFVPIPYCFDDCSFIDNLKPGSVIPPALFFFNQDCFGYSGSFVAPYTF